MNNLSLSTVGGALGAWIASRPEVQEAAAAIDLRVRNALAPGAVPPGLLTYVDVPSIKSASDPRDDGWGTAEDWARAGFTPAKAAIAAQEDPRPFPWLLAAAALLLAAVVLR